MSRNEISAERGAAVWASMPLPVFLIDAGDRIVDANPAAEAFLNIAARSLRGQPMFDILTIDAPIEDALGRVRADESSMAINAVDVGAGHQPPVTSNVQIAPVGGVEGQLMLILHPRQFVDRMAPGEHATTAARSAVGLAEMLAHEIKNPLAGISGAAQLLAMNLGGEDREMTDLIVAETRRILKLIQQVEEFGNVQAPDRQVVNVHDLLDRARKSAEIGHAAHMRFVESYDPSLPPTYVDGDQMLQVFLNLLKNAAEAAPDGGTITLRTFYDHALRLRRKDGAAPVPLQVEIIDDGPGVPDGIAKILFEPFVSGRENGTGLGLALVSRIITENDGWITLDSVPGRTRFRISLPAAPRGAKEQGG